MQLNDVKRDDNYYPLAWRSPASTAKRTKNQKAGYPSIEQNDGVVIGNKGAAKGYPKGTAIPPTRVDIIRPDKKN